MILYCADWSGIANQWLHDLRSCAPCRGERRNEGSLWDELVLRESVFPIQTLDPCELLDFLDEDRDQKTMLG